MDLKQTASPISLSSVCLCFPLSVGTTLLTINHYFPQQARVEHNLFQAPPIVSLEELAWMECREYKGIGD